MCTFNSPTHLMVPCRCSDTAVCLQHAWDTLDTILQGGIPPKLHWFELHFAGGKRGRLDQIAGRKHWHRQLVHHAEREHGISKFHRILLPHAKGGGAVERDAALSTANVANKTTLLAFVVCHHVNSSGAWFLHTRLHPRFCPNNQAIRCPNRIYERTACTLSDAVST